MPALTAVQGLLAAVTGARAAIGVAGLLPLLTPLLLRGQGRRQAEDAEQRRVRGEIARPVPHAGRVGPRPAGTGKRVKRPRRPRTGGARGPR